ncbi:TM2 domain-containing protein [Chryseobacterium ginsengisoli]|uniref:TM2 domain-containing protein n=1 Tax=Chryseobacterium ginsengisoli TaxID=363853 RepID=A0ABP9MK05_9FLAO
MKDKITAGLFALLLGGFGVHKFYLNKPVQGIIYILFFWTFIPALIALVEGIIYLTMDDNTFNLKYNEGRSKPISFSSNVDELEKLAKLRNSGAISEQEYNTLKERMFNL